MDDAALGRNSDDTARIDGARTMDDATLGQRCAQTTLRSDNVRIDSVRMMYDSSLRGDKKCSKPVAPARNYREFWCGGGVMMLDLLLSTATKISDDGIRAQNTRMTEIFVKRMSILESMC